MHVCESTVCVCRPGEGGACNDSVVMAEVHIHAAKLGVVLLLFTFEKGSAENSGEVNCACERLCSDLYL